MTIIYLPALLFSLWSLFSHSHPASPTMPLVQSLLAAHFGKRFDWESLQHIPAGFFAPCLGFRERCLWFPF